MYSLSTKPSYYIGYLYQMQKIKSGWVKMKFHDGQLVNSIKEMPSSVNLGSCKQDVPVVGGNF